MLLLLLLLLYYVTLATPDPPVGIDVRPAAQQLVHQHQLVDADRHHREAAQQWGGPIFGGDIATCDDTTPIFSVTAVATPPTSGAITRAGSQEGDYVCVTGTLGNSSASHHLTFVPRIKEARELLHDLQDHLHAMIDVSDGLAQDASHIATEHVQMNRIK